MGYWRMQLHPDEPRNAVRNTIATLAAGYIGIDVPGVVRDLTTTQPVALSAGQREAVAFAQDYVCSPVPEHGILFRHFRAVDDVRYYADLAPNAREWESILVTERMAPLNDPNSMSYLLSEHWLRAG